MMPPNTQQRQETEEEQVQDMNSISFIHHFWSKDKSGMTQLLNYIQSTHDDLETLCTLFIQRSQLEKEYGEKLLALSKSPKQKEDAKDGIPVALQTVRMELKNTAHSHLDLSAKLDNQVALDFQMKLDEYKLLLEKWTKTLDDLYAERQAKIMELLKTRAKYLKEYDLSKSQSTPIMDSLKNQYKRLVEEVDNLAHDWNSTWKEACEVMEAMEEDRVEFLKSNVWEYANLASASLLVQDEWCENIRKQLEKCSVEEEIGRCISLCATGSKIPTTNEYVGELMREQKKKHQVQSSTAPKPPSKPPKQALSQPDNNNKASSRDTRAVNQSSHPARQYSNDTSRLLMDKATCRHPQNQEENKNDSESSPHRQQSEDEQEQQANNYIRYNRNQRPRQEQQQSEVHAPSPQQQLVDQHAYNNNSIRKSQYGDNERMNQIRNKVSDNMGSTATRGQIKRKPLNKSLMEQVTNEMAMARQRDAEHQQAVENSVKKSNRSHRKTNSNGSLDSLLKTFEGGEAPKAAPSHPIAAVSEEAKSRRQPSEYKPDTGSIPVRRGIENNAAMNRVLQEINPIEPSAQQKQQDPLLTHQVAPPKSPRPPPQQIVGEVQPVEGTDPYQHLQHYSTSPSITPSSTPPEHNSYINQQYLTNQNYPNQHMGPPPNAPQHQQYMMQPQRSPMMQPQVSPMMQPQRSPMMQPQRSPMMQPQVSPLMQPQRSPMMTPMLHSPMIQPQQQQQLQQRGATLPPPITIPASNYMASSPQPSPAISYSNLGPVSPGGILPPPQYPAIPQQQALPRPALYSDGRPIQFWVRAKYDYGAKENDELSFKAYNLIGILAIDVTHQGWWTGAIYDEYRQTWSIPASVPSNFMEKSC